MKKVSIKKINNKAIIPTRGSTGAPGYDIYSTEFYVLKPGEKKVFNTGLSMTIPTGMYGRFLPSGGTGYKKGVGVLTSVVDEDFRGELEIVLINLSKENYSVLVGDKIAQIIFEEYDVVDFVEELIQPDVSKLENLPSLTPDIGNNIMNTQINPTIPTNFQMQPEIPRSLLEQNKNLVVKNPTTLDKFYGENSVSPIIKKSYMKTHFSQFKGELHEFEENGLKGLCIVDASGSMNPASKVPLARA